MAAVCSAAEEAPKENPLARPFWAENETPEAVRGRIVGEADLKGQFHWRFKEEKGNNAYTLSPLPQDDLRIFDRQYVEIKGYYGFNLHTRKFLFQATTSPQILVPAHWSIPFLLLLACIACF